MWILILLAVLILACLLFSHGAYRIAFDSPKKKRKTDHRSFSSNPALGEIRREFLSRVDRVEAAEFLPLTATSRDGLTLFGRYYENRKGAPVEIAFHGYRSTALHDGCVAYESALRYDTNLLLVDQRAHGASDGHTIAFGVTERYDVLTWVEEVKRRFGENTEILLSGVSMGAATVLMASSLPLPENVKGILADCPYSSPKEIIGKVAADHRLPRHIVYPFVRLGALLFGHFDPSAASAVTAVREAKAPILLVHGEGDTFVPCEMSRAIAAANPSVDFFTYPGADHGMSYFTDPVRYRNMCDDFRRKVLSPDEKKDEKSREVTPDPLTKRIASAIMIHGREFIENKGGISMTEVYITLKTIQDIRDFVNAVILLDYEVDLVQGRYVIDAKSIMGIFSLDLLSPIKVEAHTDDPDTFYHAIDRFIVKK